MQEVHTELEVVVAADEVGRVGNLVAALIRVSRTIEEGCRAELERIRDVYVRRSLVGVGVGTEWAAGWNVIKRGVFVGSRSLRALIFEVATILVANFVRETLRDLRVQLANQEGVLDVVVAEAGDAVSEG